MATSMSLVVKKSGTHDTRFLVNKVVSFIDVWKYAENAFLLLQIKKPPNQSLPLMLGKHINTISKLKQVIYSEIP